MERLPDLPKNAERALSVYDGEIRKMMRKLRRWSKLTHTEVANIVEALDLEAQRLCRDLWTAGDKLPSAVTKLMPKGRVPTSWPIETVRFVAGETWRMRFQPQDL